MVLVQVQKLETWIDMEFYTSVAKGLKLNVWKFLGLIPTFVEANRVSKW